MPQATPRRSGREPEPGSRFPGEVLADNVRSWRRGRDFSQAQLAERMTTLGHPWTESIVGFVERGQRNVTVDELVGLAVTLKTAIGDLLDPAGFDGRVTEATERLDIGLSRGSLPAAMAAAWVRGALVLGLKPDGRRGDDDLDISAADLPDPEAEAASARRAWIDWLAERVHGREEAARRRAQRQASPSTDPEEGP